MPVYRSGVLRSLANIAWGMVIVVDEHGTTRVGVGEPVATVRVHDADAFYRAVALGEGDIGLGESYVDGAWDTDAIATLMLVLVGNSARITGGAALGTHKTGASDLRTDASAVQHHYDAGNEFYETFLTDRLMAYTCGFFLCPSDTLDQAQHNKVERLIAKMDAQPGDAVLDIGCGWGRIAAYVAERTGTIVTGTSVAHEQLRYIRENVPSVRGAFCHHMDMGARMREGGLLPSGKSAFDRAYSIGMFEHVRCRNYDLFFANVAAVLRPGGRLVLHTISTNRDDTRCDSGATRIFVTKHIFPEGQIPKVEWVMQAAARNGFDLLHLETLAGSHYARTLRHWRQNMMAARERTLARGWATDRLVRAYEYYFASCEAAFENNQMQLSHFVFTKRGADAPPVHAQEAELGGFLCGRGAATP